ncbi:hypothetical protein PtB15_16B289 [Puccinia triticina]|nr:hypothetical protein PtB15_16B289 [Puccinia triticina]
MAPFSLPSFSPATLQHNLLSYLVRRFLGPLLKHPLDHQLATPAHPGTFVLKHVQLDPQVTPSPYLRTRTMTLTQFRAQALQDQLAGSLAPFAIHAVSVAELALQINWPSWSFSLQGYVPDVKVSARDVQVTLAVSEHPPSHSPQHEPPSHLLNPIHLDENLATIAHDFVGQGWPESSAYDDPSDQLFPGAFTTRTNPASAADHDQRGFFAGLVQNILAKFNFELTQLTVILNHQHLQALLSIDSITSLDLSSDEPHPPSSISREIRTSCPVIYLKPLSDQEADRPGPPSSPNSSSNQSLDSEHDMLMSQATVDLRRPAPLFASAAETLDPIDEQNLLEKPSPSEPIIKPENVVLQFIGTSTNGPAQEPSTESSELSPKDSRDHLDPNNSLRFLFWVANSPSSSSAEEEATPSTTQPGSTDTPTQDPPPEPSIQQCRPQLNIQIHLPVLAVSIRLPRHLNALTQLVSTLMSTIPSTSTSPPASAPETPSLAISAELKLHALNGTLAFPTPYPESATPGDDLPLSSISVQAHLIDLVFNTPLAQPVTETLQANQPRSELTLRVDQIKGGSEIIHTSSSTRLKSVFLLAPARDDHASPALSVTHTIDSMQIICSSIWLNLDLDVLAVLIPLIDAVRASSMPANRPSSSGVSGAEDHPKTSAPLSGAKKEDKYTTTVSIPCLYMDVQSPGEMAPARPDRCAGERVLGAVLKSFQMIATSEGQIGCSIFEVALGFRVGTTAEARARAPLSPFLGIAHACIPASKDQHHRFPGLRLTHILPPPTTPLDPARSSSENEPGHRPTSFKLETVTIDFSKDQFDRLQYWVDDLGRWATALSIASPPASSGPSSHADQHRPCQSKAATGRRQEEDDNRSGKESLVGTLTVSKIALTIRLPPADLPSQRSPPPPIKLVIQFDLLSIHQLRLPLHAEFDAQTRLLIRACSAALHHNSTGPPVPILYRAPDHDLLEPPSADSSAVSLAIFATQSPPPEARTSQPKKIQLGLQVSHTIVRLGPCCTWTAELARFLKAPAGVFEAVGPEYRSQISVDLAGCALELVAPPPPSSTAATMAAPGPAADDCSANEHAPPPAFVLQILATHARLSLALDPQSSVVSPLLAASLLVSLAEAPASSSPVPSDPLSFAEIVALDDLAVSAVYAWTSGRPTCRTTLHRGNLAVSLCADSTDSLADVISRLSAIPFQAKADLPREDVESSPPAPRVEDPIVASTMLRSAMRESSSSRSRSILIQKDEDLAEEDYPSNVAFLDQKQPTLSHHHHHLVAPNTPAILRPLSGQGLNIIDDYLLNVPSPSKASSQTIEAEVQVEDLDVVVRFYDGYDWNSTRQTIQQAQKTVRKKLQKIRQLLATGTPADARSMEENLGPTTLFESVHLGLDASTRGLSTAQLLDAIDDQLEKEPGEPASDDPESMTDSWQSLAAHPSKDHPPPRLVSVPSSKQQHLARSAQPMLNILLNGVQGRFRKYQEPPPSRPADPSKDDQSNDARITSLHLKTDALTIIDNVPTSTWKKFLTELRPGEGGMMRPTGAPMLRLSFLVTPSARLSARNEAIVKLKISPLRLYVDQDAVDFLKTFFAFQNHASPSPASASPISSSPESAGPPVEGLFFQRVEILPIRIKLDYKPKRVNYMALKEGKTIELMNFFHFEGSDMVLRHATLTGISRASKIGELLQEIWTPDVKANQLADVISGIAPVRSVVNLGTGIADLVLLPIEEMKKKDGRLSRGIQKGTSSFAKNTTLEVLKLGARLAVGTQVILEKAEAILGASAVNHPLRGETIVPPTPAAPSTDPSLHHHHHPEQVSRYALQPQSFALGAHSAYLDLRDNFRSTAQTILAVPLEVFNEGSGHAVVKAIPIAILHPIVGASGAISKTLLGLHNSLDPNASASLLLDKYKQDSPPRP